MSSSIGNSNVAGRVEVLDLTSASKEEQRRNQLLMLEIQAQQHSFSIDVPTLPNDVREALRRMGLPVRLFGENLANVRDRLRMELARQNILKGHDVKQEGQEGGTGVAVGGDDDDEEEITKYSRASSELIRSREKFTQYSLRRARVRLERERNYRIGWQRKRKERQSKEDSKLPPQTQPLITNYIDTTLVEDECMTTYKKIKKFGLEGSQYGDNRPISCIATALSNVPVIATGSWSGTIKLWNESLNLISQKAMAHEDRIMGIAFQPYQNEDVVSFACGNHTSTLLATASIDLTAKLWKLNTNEREVQQENMEEIELNNDTSSLSSSLQIQEVAHLKGHASRLCKVEFHPRGEHVITTSHDHTWRLWDVETGGEILLQDGHWKEVYGVGFHSDGSLCSTTDYGGIVHLWDLRTGKSIHQFLGHAKRVLCAEFSSNGFQLATAGDDGFIKIWDLRKRKQYATIPAHSRSITQLRFEKQVQNYNNGFTGGEYLVSSSFDCTAKVWSSRDWKILKVLKGHEGKVAGAGVLKDSVVTCGFDKTLKIWK